LKPATLKNYDHHNPVELVLAGSIGPLFLWVLSGQMDLNHLLQQNFVICSGY
jgi:hypothetical protein